MASQIRSVRPVWTGLKLSSDLNQLRSVSQPKKTAKNHDKLVSIGCGLVFRLIWISETGPGPGPSKNGQKTELDRTFKHYLPKRTICPAYIVFPGLVRSGYMVSGTLTETKTG